MQIECMTTSAAAAVLLVLIDAHLRPAREFHITAPPTLDPPIQFTLHVNLPAAVVLELLEIPDTRIVNEREA